MNKNKKQRKHLTKKRKTPLEFLYNSSIRNKLNKVTLRRHFTSVLLDSKSKSLETLIPKAFNFPIVRRIFCLENYTYKTIGEGNRFPSLNDSSKELIYLTNLFLVNINSLNKFIHTRMVFEKYYITGKIDEALEVLDVFEKNYGVTIWGIENKIYCTYELLGLEGTKSICLEYKDKIENKFLQYLIDQYLSKVDGDTPELHIKGVSAVVNEYRQGGVIESGDAISSLLIPLEYDQVRRSYHCLLYFSNMPIFDQYLYFKQSVQEILLVEEMPSADKDIINKFYNKFSHDDCPLISSNLIYEVDSKIKNSVREYTIGNYSDSALESKKLIEKDLKYLSLIGIYCKSLILSPSSVRGFNENSLLYKISTYLINIFILSGDSDLFLKKIEMLMIKYSRHSWSWSLFSQLYEMYPDVFLKYSVFSQKKLILSNVYLTPKFTYDIYQEDNGNLFDYISDVLDITDVNLIPISRLIKHDIYRNINSEYALSDIQIDDPHLLPYEIKKITAKYYLNLNNIESASIYIVQECIKKAYLLRIMPVLVKSNRTLSLDSFHS